MVAARPVVGSSSADPRLFVPASQVVCLYLAEGNLRRVVVRTDAIAVPEMPERRDSGKGDQEAAISRSLEVPVRRRKLHGGLDFLERKELHFWREEMSHSTWQ